MRGKQEKNWELLLGEKQAVVSFVSNLSKIAPKSTQGQSNILKVCDRGGRGCRKA